MYRLRNLAFCCFIIIAFVILGCGEDEASNNTPEVSRAAYIINGSAQTISVFALDTNEIRNDVFTTGKYPNDIKFLEDKAYIVNTGDNNVQIVDLKTLTTVGNINIGDGTSPEKIGILDAGKAYVSCNWTKSTKAVDLTGQKVIKEIPVGVAPWGVAVSGK
ncbi:hypothetical protein FJZ33_07780, partial [Candidatus Poribacteria bacterium]|nr:hypothetical protein [Candidatus Poribacteria bacterium]